jgi:hypothetical protein
MPPATMRPFAALAVTTLLSCESFGGGAASTAFDRAYLVRSFFNKGPETAPGLVDI